MGTYPFESWVLSPGSGLQVQDPGKFVVRSGTSVLVGPCFPAWFGCGMSNNNQVLVRSGLAFCSSAWVQVLAVKYRMGLVQVRLQDGWTREDLWSV